MITEKIENSKAVFPKAIGDVFGIKGESKKLILNADFREDSKFVTIFYENSAGEAKNVSLYPGDQLNFCYSVDFDFLKHIPIDEAVFPIELEFNEQSYRLNKTKNGKLILTK